MTDASKTVINERIAVLTAHRACCGTEHDPANGKLHGCCVICGVPWPCAYAGTPAQEAINLRLLAELDEANERIKDRFTWNEFEGWLLANGEIPKVVAIERESFREYVAQRRKENP